jgi:hypothetical protein
MTRTILLPYNNDDDCIVLNQNVELDFIESKLLETTALMLISHSPKTNNPDSELIFLHA